MSKVLIILTIFFSSVLFSGCSNSDKPDFNFSLKNLSQTNWNGINNTLTNDKIVGKTDFKISFTSETEAIYTYVDEYGSSYKTENITYNIKNKKINFIGPIAGTWKITENDERLMVMESYLPQKHIIILERRL